MSTNKKFRIQNGVDVVGELSINDVTVIGADGKVVAGAIQDAVASLTAADIADLQSQVTAILGTSPETLDTLQEIVTAFQDADTNLVASVASNSSDIATINATLTSGVATPADVAALEAFVKGQENSEGLTDQYLIVPSEQQNIITVVKADDLSIVKTIESPYPSGQGGFGKNTVVSGTSIFVDTYDDSGNYDDRWLKYDVNDLDAAPVELAYEVPTRCPVFDDSYGYGTYGSGSTTQVARLNKNDLTVDTLISRPAGASTNSFSGVYAIQGTKLFVGDVQYNAGDGQVFVYDTTDLNAAPSVLTASPSAEYQDIERFGNNISANDKWVAVSGYTSDGNGYNSTGSVHVFDMENLSAAPIALPVQHSGHGGGFGSDVQVSNGSSNIVFVGARNVNSNDGKVYVFDVTSPSSPIHTFEIADQYTDLDPTSLPYPEEQSFGSYMAINSATLFVSSPGAATVSGTRVGAISKFDLSDFTAAPVVVYGTTEGQFDVRSSFLNFCLTAEPTPLLNTTATQVVPAVNELHAEIEALSSLQSGDASSLTSAIATAKSEAISTAAADATTKADQAEADAKAYADQVVAATVDAAPAALDTLNELSAALGDDANFASTVTASIATKASQVDHDAEVARATAAEQANAAAIAAANARTSGLSTSSGSTDIEMTANVTLGDNNITDVNDIYAARGFIDTVESNDLKVQTGTADFEGSIVNFGSATITGTGFSSATDTQIDNHINVSTANAGEFVKWTGTDYEWTDLVSGRLATDQLQIASGGSIEFTGPGGTLDVQDATVHFGGSDVIVDTPTSASHAANKSYVDGVVAATVDAAPAALDTLNELAAALGDDANFASTVTASISTKADDAATTAALATKADDAATTAALATKEDKTVVAALDSFVKGTGTSYFNVPDASYWTMGPNGSIGGNDDLFTLANPASNTTFGGAIINSVAVKASELLTVGEEYTVSFYGFPGIGVPAVWKVIVHGANLTPSNQIIEEFEFTSEGDYSFTFTSPDDRVYISITTPSGSSSNHRAAFIRNLDITSASSLDTTAIQVVPAINELHTEINALSSSTTGDKSNLQAQINSEVIRATAAEAANAANIVSETSARSSADAALESDIIGLQSQVSTIIQGSPASLDTLVEIVSAFETADASLSGVITANGGRLTTAENNITALQTDLDAEETARGAGDASLQSQINALTGTTDSDTSSLQSQLTAEVARATAAEGVNASAISSETSRATAAEAGLSSDIVTEADTRIAADDAETSARTIADAALESAINAEVARATGAEAGLQSAIDFVKQNTDPAALDSLTEIVAAFQNADSNISGVVSSNTTRIGALESGLTVVEGYTTDNISEGSVNKYWTEQRTKDCLTGGLCISYNSTTGEIKVDEAEAESSLRVAESVASDDADKLDGQQGTFYRINVYDVNGSLVN